MTAHLAADPALAREMEKLAVPGLLLGHRLISPGDEDALLAEETASIASPVVQVRRARGAARIVARQLLAQRGHRNAPVPRSASGAPIWPAGIIGSLAHDDAVAVAAVGLRHDFQAIGIDVEPAVALPPGVLALVATPQEQNSIAGDPVGGKLLFAAKEAVYKALYPLDQTFLEFGDIEIDLAGHKAMTRTGRALVLRYCVSPRVMVLALIQA